MPAEDDMFDGREFYAAKSVTDGKKRYMVGWESIREDCRDNGRHLWEAPSAELHEHSREDGSLGVRLPETIEDSFQKELRDALTQTGKLCGG